MGKKERLTSNCDVENQEGFVENAKQARVVHDEQMKYRPKKRKDMTPQQKRKQSIIAGVSVGTVFVIIAMVIGFTALAGTLGFNGNMQYIETLETIGTKNDFVVSKTTGEGEYGWTFTFEESKKRDLKVLQLTDIHIGAGGWSVQKDKAAINAIYALVKEAQPDLVVITGDIAYPVGFQSGSFDNLREAKLFTKLMNQIGVYWAFVFGNHDTEVYSKYDRMAIGKYYESNNIENAENSKMLFTVGKDAEDTAQGMGVGNYTIDVMAGNTLVHTLYMFDSHSYTDDAKSGISWKYDNIHQSQVDWYENLVDKRHALNPGSKSTAYFHIPLVEFRQAWYDFLDNGKKEITQADVDAGKFEQPVKLINGTVGETGKMVYSGDGEDNLYESMVGASKTTGERNTIGIFCGHDHYNNFSIQYGKIRFTYGMSIDYLAYPTIYKETSQRGGRTIVINHQTGEFETNMLPYTVDWKNAK